MKAPFGVLVLVLVLASSPARAKEYGIHTPGGRAIYEVDERFDDAVNQHTRRFVVEAAVGAGPEGNIAALVGALNLPVRGLDFYAGFGLELNHAHPLADKPRVLARADVSSGPAAARKQPVVSALTA